MYAGSTATTMEEVATTSSNKDPEGSTAAIGGAIEGAAIEEGSIDLEDSNLILLRELDINSIVG